MKKIINLLTVALMALATFAFTSCEKKDPLANGKYAFYKPCLNWELNKSGVRAYMDADIDWEEDVDSEEEDAIYYTNRKTEAMLTYEFEADKLRDVSVWYFAPSQFEQMKQDWQLELGFELQKDEIEGHRVYDGYWEDNTCDVYLQPTAGTIPDFMSVNFHHMPHK